MDILINDIEARVLGSLMEKALATPEYYPLSLNALTNACNQKSSRDPVVSYDESTVQAAADSLEKADLVGSVNLGRVTKYEELLSAKHNLLPKETAVLCVLLLRGPQTIGEIRGRAARMYSFDNAEALAKTLENLRDWGFVRRLERLAGHKETRFAHLLCGLADIPDKTGAPAEITSVSASMAGRIETIESEVADLRADVEQLRQLLQDFKKQFE